MAQSSPHGEQTADGLGHRHGSWGRVESGGWREWSGLGGWSTVGEQEREAVRMKPGRGLNGQSPDRGSESQGKGGVMRAGWGSVSSMCPDPLPIPSGSQAYANFSYLGLPWQPHTEAVEHLHSQLGVGGLLA